MLKYLNHNVNPKGRKTGDCSTRALVGCLGISYDEALKLQVEMALKTYYDLTSRKVIAKVLEKFGYVKMRQPKKVDGTKYCVKEMDRVVGLETLEKGVIVGVANHWVAIKGNNYIDTWNSGNKCVGNYYIKQ